MLTRRGATGINRESCQKLNENVQLMIGGIIIILIKIFIINHKGNKHFLIENQLFHYVFLNSI